MKNVCLNCNKEFETGHDYKFCCCTECESALIEKGKQFLFNQVSRILGPIVQTLTETGNDFKEIKKANRAETYWKLSHAMLWPYQNFHEGEVNKFKRQINELFKNSEDVDSTFIELVEKACLAKRHIEEKEDRFIPLPEAWFDTTNPFGISSTEKWYKALLRQRFYNPSFNQGLLVFAKAVMSYADTRNILDIPLYRKKFIELTHYDLLQWYINVVMHLQFIEF